MKNGKDPVAEERKLLEQLADARRRDEARRSRAQGDLDVLQTLDAELLEEGRKEDLGEQQRLMLARRVKELRWKIGELTHRIENIYNKRLKVFNEHINTLTQLVELHSEELPDRNTISKMAVEARMLLDNLEKSRELAEGISRTVEPRVVDPEEEAIMRQMRGETAEPEAEPLTMAEAIAEASVAEPLVQEPKPVEKPPEEKPEVMFE